MSDRSPEALLRDFLRGALMTKALAVVVDLGVSASLGPSPTDSAPPSGPGFEDGLIQASCRSS